MKTLALLRHAKSSWGDPALADHERPLNGRGRDAAARMARHLAAGALPALVLCSPARRTRETLDALRPHLAADARVRIEAELYGAELATLRRLVAELPDAAPAALLIGHNPGLEELALWLLAEPETAAARRLRQKFPTATVARFELGVERWAALAPGCGALVEFTRPRDLAE